MCETQPSLKFAMVTTFYPPYHFGGDAIYIYRLCNELARRGHTVEVVHCTDAYHSLHRADPPNPQNFPNHPNVRVHHLKSAWGVLSPLATQQTGYPLFKSKALREVLEGQNFDVIHFHNISLVGGPKVLEYGSSDSVKLYTTHEHWLVCPMHVLWKYNRELCTRPACLSCSLSFKRPPQLWRYTNLLQNKLAAVDAFIAPSRFTMSKHREFGLDLPMVHIPYFLPRSEESSAPPAEDLSLAPPTSERPYFLFVGRLEKIKGLHNLIEVFRTYDRADLLVAGAGEYGEVLQNQAAGLSHIKFLGRQSQAQLRELYRQAQALIVPSICYEVFGIISIEAFALSTPVIAHNLGPLPEVIEESGGGLLYDSETELVAAMEQIRTNPALRQQLGTNGYEAYLNLWSEEPHLRQYFGLIEEIKVRKKQVRVV